MEATIAIATTDGEKVKVETWRCESENLPGIKYLLRNNGGRMVEVKTCEKKKKKHRPAKPRHTKPEDTNPYPGVSFKVADGKWWAQINRPALRWFAPFSTPEEARDALNKKLKEYNLKPVRKIERN